MTVPFDPRADEAAESRGPGRRPQAADAWVLEVQPGGLRGGRDEDAAVERRSRRDPAGGPTPSVGAAPAEGLDGGRAGAGPLRHRPARRPPGDVPLRVRTPEAAGAAPLG